MISPPVDNYRVDALPPYRKRVYLPAFATLDPLALPWREMRRHPENYPDFHVAKISGARTVVGCDFSTAEGRLRVYVKRSLVRGRLKQLVARFRDSKEWREFQLARQFLSSRIHVPQPVFYSEALTPENTPVVFLATLALEPRWIEAKAYFKSTRQFTAAWESIAHFTRTLHERHILHGDYRSDHLYLDETLIRAGDHANAWALIDLDGSSLGDVIKPRDRERAIRQLTESLLTSGLTADDLARFLRLYDPQSTLALDPKAIHAHARKRQKK